MFWQITPQKSRRHSLLPQSIHGRKDPRCHKLTERNARVVEAMRCRLSACAEHRGRNHSIGRASLSRDGLGRLTTRLCSCGVNHRIVMSLHRTARGRLPFLSHHFAGSRTQGRCRPFLSERPKLIQFARVGHKTNLDQSGPIGNHRIRPPARYRRAPSPACSAKRPRSAPAAA